jgi:hypothetical protein
MDNILSTAEVQDILSNYLSVFSAALWLDINLSSESLPIDDFLSTTEAQSIL